jgi:hypothetical protein
MARARRGKLVTLAVLVMVALGLYGLTLVRIGSMLGR